MTTIVVLSVFSHSMDPVYRATKVLHMTATSSVAGPESHYASDEENNIGFWKVFQSQTPCPHLYISVLQRLQQSSPRLANAKPYNDKKDENVSVLKSDYRYILHIHLLTRLIRIIFKTKLFFLQMKQLHEMKK